jgi:hypothetical protein
MPPALRTHPMGEGQEAAPEGSTATTGVIARLCRSCEDLRSHARSNHRYRHRHTRTLSAHTHTCTHTHACAQMCACVRAGGRACVRACVRAGLLDLESAEDLNSASALVCRWSQCTRRHATAYVIDEAHDRLRGVRKKRCASPSLTAADRAGGCCARGTCQAIARKCRKAQRARWHLDPIPRTRRCPRPAP